MRASSLPAREEHSHCGLHECPQRPSKEHSIQKTELSLYHSFKPRPAATARTISGPNTADNTSAKPGTLSVCVCVCVYACACARAAFLATAKLTNLWSQFPDTLPPIRLDSAFIISVARWFYSAHCIMPS